MPDANGFWTAAERDAYNQFGTIPGSGGSMSGGGGRSASEGYTSQEQRNRLFGDTRIIDPQGRDVRQADAGGRWETDPVTMKPVWVPWGTGAEDAGNIGEMARDIAAAGGAGAGLNDVLTGATARAAYYGGQRGAAPPPPATPPPVIPGRSRSGAANGGASGPGAPPPNATPDDIFNQFVNWWTGKVPWQETMVDYTGKAPYNPRTGQNMGGPTDIGALYNRYGVGTPWMGRSGAAYLPGQAGRQFSAELMRSNPGLFLAGLQADQLERGQRPAGPIFPWVPPQAGSQGGRPAFAAKDVAGGAYGPGQALVAGHGAPIAPGAPNAQHGPFQGPLPPEGHMDTGGGGPPAINPAWARLLQYLSQNGGNWWGGGQDGWSGGAWGRNGVPGPAGGLGSGWGGRGGMPGWAGWGWGGPSGWGGGWGGQSVAPQFSGVADLLSSVRGLQGGWGGAQPMQVRAPTFRAAPTSMWYPQRQTPGAGPRVY